VIGKMSLVVNTDEVTEHVVQINSPLYKLKTTNNNDNLNIEEETDNGTTIKGTFFDGESLLINNTNIKKNGGRCWNFFCCIFTSSTKTTIPENSKEMLFLPKFMFLNESKEKNSPKENEKRLQETILSIQPEELNEKSTGVTYFISD
jgi:hypothetical protein